MVNEDLKRSVLENIAQLSEAGHKVVMVHGGGPFINAILEKVQLSSEFIGGHRKTTPEAMKYIEMALKGEVNTSLVALMNAIGKKAVGLSGKDGGMIKVKKRFHMDGDKEIDLGQVGDVSSVDPSVILDLLDKDYIPIIACVAADENGMSYNINADMMAGAIAGALNAKYVVMTDVDGIRMDKDDPDTLIKKLKNSEVAPLMDKVIVGGMIPKIESCQIALESGAEESMIINGTTKDELVDVILNGKSTGTIITKK